MSEDRASVHPSLREALPMLGRRLDRCWVCSNRLFDEDSGSLDHLREEHHIIPSAYGGADGPTTSLCASHHSLLHLIAVKMLSNRYSPNLLVGLEPGPKEKLLYLATRVVVAARLMKDDPNKRVVLSISIPRSFNNEVAKLATFKNLSKEGLILDLLRREIHRCFPKRTV